MSSFTNTQTNPNNKFNVCIGTDTDIGGGRENQDKALVYTDSTRNVVVISVLDGHGADFGKLAADSSSEAINSLLSSNPTWIVDNPIECLTACFETAHNAIRNAIVSNIQQKGQYVHVTPEGFILKKTFEHSSWTLVRSGTTCTIVAIVGKTLYSANVGDSEAVMFSKYPVLQNSIKQSVDTAIPSELSLLETPVSNDLQNFIELCADHSPTSTREFDRMRKSNPDPTNPANPYLLTVFDKSGLDKTYCPPIFDTSSGNPIILDNIGYFKNVRHEPACYVSTQAFSPFEDVLAMTRSLGDFYLGYHGVSHLPEIQFVNLDEVFSRIVNKHNHLSQNGTSITKPPVLCVVLGSDGFWDNWIIDHVQKFVMDASCLNALFSRPDNGAQRIAKSLIVRNDLFAKKNFGSSRDNATGIVMYITLKD
jgi:serine/threonine protein phosphatase PrpC